MLRRLSSSLFVPLALGLVAPVVVGACSSSHHPKARAGRSPACPLIADLDATVATVSKADVSNPVTFKQTLDDAVVHYVATVDRLQKVVPATLQGDLDRIAAAVHQYRFSDALAASGALDAYAATTCGRTPPTVALSTTTIPAGLGATTTPSSESTVSTPDTASTSTTVGP